MPLNYAFNSRLLWLLRLLATANLSALLLPGRSGENILDMAIQTGDQDMIKYLIESGGNWILGSDPSIHLTLPLLHFFALRGNKKLVEILLELGADANLPDHRAKTPMYHAVQSDSADVLLVLLNNGAKLEHKDSDGNTPILVTAGTDGAASIIGLLMSRSPSLIIDVDKKIKMSCISRRQ